MSPTEVAKQFVAKPTAPAWLSAFVSIAGILIVVGVLWADVRSNTKHREAWSHVDPEKMRDVPEHIAAISEQIKGLRRDLNLARQHEEQRQ